jgi:hypothetical protein
VLGLLRLERVARVIGEPALEELRQAFLANQGKLRER